jgi:hypothetical protein
MTDRRGERDKHVTVPDAVKVGVSSHTATITVTGIHCNGANRSNIYWGRKRKKTFSAV